MKHDPEANKSVPAWLRGMLGALTGLVGAALTISILVFSAAGAWWFAAQQLSVAPTATATMTASAVAVVAMPTDTVTPSPSPLTATPTPSAVPPATATPLPPTFTPTATPEPVTVLAETPTPTLPPDTPTATPTPTATFTATAPPPTATSTVTPSATPVLPDAPGLVGPTPTTIPPRGVITLLSPLTSDRPTHGLTVFDWQWVGDVIPPVFGFEVSVWRAGEAQAGVHDAVADNLNGQIERINENRYRLRVSNLRYAKGVLGREGFYLWTVALVRVEPGYEGVGLQAEPLKLRYQPLGN